MDYDLYELVLYLAKLKETDIYDDDSGEKDLEEFIYDHYEINIENFGNLIKDLLPLCDKGESPLTNKLYQGFGIDNFWLIKQEVK